jgi:hypothetical protein
MDEAQKLLDALKETAPQLVAGLTPQPLPLASVAALCRSLLAEGIPLKDFRRIAEAMVDTAREESDLVRLAEGVRQRLGAVIVQTVAPARMPLPVLTLDAELEGLLTQAIRTGADAMHPIEPKLAQKIIEAISEVAAPYIAQARRVALVTSPIARRRARTAARSTYPRHAGALLPGDSQTESPSKSSRLSAAHGLPSRCWQRKAIHDQPHPAEQDHFGAGRWHSLALFRKPMAACRRSNRPRRWCARTCSWCARSPGTCMPMFPRRWRSRI